MQSLVGTEIILLVVRIGAESSFNKGEKRPAISGKNLRFNFNLNH